MASALHVLDYIVVILMLCISVAIGIYFKYTGGKQKTLEEFLMAGKNMSTLPVTFSLMASFMSSISLLGYPTEVYFYGTQMAVKPIGVLAAGLIAAFMYLPVFYDMGVTTAYEYLEKRFGKILRIVVSLMYCIQTVLYMGSTFYAPSVSLNVVTGISKWGSITTLALICTLYCLLGGLKAVLWTDVFQVFLMYASVLTLAIGGTAQVGGIQELFQIAKRGKRLQILNTSISLTERNTLWGNFLNGLLLFLGNFGANQTEIQRFLSVRSLKIARRALLFSVVLITSFGLLAIFNGIVLYGLFHDCDPILQPPPKFNLNSVNQITPYAITMLFEKYPGLVGLCIAGIFSASLSTVSSALNSLATVVTEDYIRPFCFRNNSSPKWLIVVVKCIEMGFGALCLLVSLSIENFRGLYEAAASLLALLNGPILGVFSLGIFTTAANELGTLLGFVMAIALNAWIIIGSNIYKKKVSYLPRSTAGCSELFPGMNLTSLSSTHTLQYNNSLSIPDHGKSTLSIYKISFLWYIIFGFTTTYISGYIFSVIIGKFRKSKKEIKPDFISPILRKWYFGGKDRQKYKNKIQDKIEGHSMEDLKFI